MKKDKKPTPPAPTKDVTPAAPAPAPAASVSAHAEDVRLRERRRHAAMPAWQVVSFVTHCVLVAALIWFTPLREIVLPEKKDVPREKLEMDPDRLERLAHDIQTIRLNELLRQLEDLQAILYNMEMMKNDILKDYDGFAEHQEGPVRESLELLLDRIITEQERTVTEQKTSQVAANAISELQVRDITDAEVTQQIAAKNDAFNEPIPRIDSAQANAQNLLDKVSVEAGLIGLKQTTATATTVRDIQLDANTMQRETRRNLQNRVHAINTEYPRATKAVTDLTAAIEKNEANRIAVNERLATEKANAETFAREAADLAKTLERLNAEHAAAQEAAEKIQQKLTPPAAASDLGS